MILTDYKINSVEIKMLCQTSINVDIDHSLDFARSRNDRNSTTKSRAFLLTPAQFFFHRRNRVPERVHYLRTL